MNIMLVSTVVNRCNFSVLSETKNPDKRIWILMLVSASHSVIRYGGGHVSSRFGREGESNNWKMNEYGKKWRWKAGNFGWFYEFDKDKNRTSKLYQQHFWTRYYVLKNIINRLGSATFLPWNQRSRTVEATRWSLMNSMRWVSHQPRAQHWQRCRCRGSVLDFV